MLRISTRKIAFAGAIAAIYAALTVALNFIGFGPIQFRVAEALCILPFFFPFSVWGLFVGCFLANLISPYPLDIIVGSAATLIAALCTALIGRSGRDNFAMKALACFPPVIINAVCIGALIAYYIAGGGKADVFMHAFLMSALQVGLGQAAVLYAIGLPLMVYLPKSRVYGKLLEIYGGCS